MDQIRNQKRLIKLQDELIQSKGEQVEAVQTTVKSEIKSFSDAVKQGCKDKITTKKLEAVVKSAVSSDDRKKGVIFFGLDESAKEELSGKVDSVLTAICSHDKPAVMDCCRVGAVKEGATRPVKVLFHSHEAAVQALRCSPSLKKTSTYSKVFMTPDLTPEERTERRKLVKDMKEKIANAPQRYHYIKNGVICSREKESSTPLAAASSQPRTDPSPVLDVTQTDVRSEASSSFQAAGKMYENNLQTMKPKKR